MKTNELIEQLQKLDPNNECEVCVNNEDIYFADRMPAYWDGRLQVLIRDPEKAPYYNITGLKVTGTGDKIKLHVMTLEDILYHNPRATVDLTSLGTNTRLEWEQVVKNIREEAIKLENEHIISDVLK